MGNVLIKGTPEVLDLASRMVDALLGSYNQTAVQPITVGQPIEEQDRAEFLAGVMISVGTLFVGMGATRDSAIQTMLDTFHHAYSMPVKQKES
jgi:hypothetical protein